MRHEINVKNKKQFPPNYKPASRERCATGKKVDKLPEHFPAIFQSGKSLLLTNQQNHQLSSARLWKRRKKRRAQQLLIIRLKDQAVGLAANGKRCVWISFFKNLKSNDFCRLINSIDETVFLTIDMIVSILSVGYSLHAPNINLQSEIALTNKPDTLAALPVHARCPRYYSNTNAHSWPRPFRWHILQCWRWQALL